MATQEERLTTLERTTAEYRAVLRDVAYELTMVKGLLIDEVMTSIQGMRGDITDLKQQMGSVERYLDRIGETLGEHTTLLQEILTRLPKKP